MQINKVYDIIGIGIGPFNLGTAALATSVPGLETIFIDRKPNFNWHPGLLIEGTRMQVPFYADLVTAADPTSPYSFLNYLHHTGRSYKFAVNEHIYPLRSEYNLYCQWVAIQLNNLVFDCACQAIHYDETESLYKVRTLSGDGKEIILHGKYIVIGIGSEPWLPAFVQEQFEPLILHSANYLTFKEKLLTKKRITIIGSGQSAAEIFSDLLSAHHEYEALNWFSRSDRFHPMDFSKLTLELSSPDYINYYYGLPKPEKTKLLKQHTYLYKGINHSLLQQIYDQLYTLEITGTKPLPLIQAGTELIGLTINSDQEIQLSLKHTETATAFGSTCDALVLATGYRQADNHLLNHLGAKIKRDILGRHKLSKNYAVDEEQTIFLQNAELHSHGFNSADLGLGPYRNATILNSILGREHFQVSHAGNTFQQFMPGDNG